MEIKRTSNPVPDRTARVIMTGDHFVDGALWSLANTLREIAENAAISPAGKDADS
ncbi:MAG: hypothetical protein GY845_13745 [Planctomycetes bacterium]|nr:hypothetical protein [Planctomycetota bacterium]